MLSMIPLSKWRQFMQQKNVRMVLLAILLLAACIQNIELFHVVAGFKLVHLAGVLLFPLILILRPNRPLGIKWWAVVGILTVHTAVTYFFFGLNSWLLNGIFCVYIVWCVWKLSSDLDKDDWLRVFRITAVVMLLCVTANILFQFDKIWEFMIAPGFHHPVYETVFGGGPNLDASWIGLFCFVMAGTVWWRPYYVASVIISLLTNSRAGLLANGAFVVWLFVHWAWTAWKEKKVFHVHYDRKKSVLSIVLAVCIVGAYGLAQAAALHGGVFVTEPDASFSQSAGETSDKGAATSLLDNLTDRMTAVGDEPGSEGRLNMWQHIPTVLTQNPLGYGLGNGIEAVRSCDPENIPDGNLHNIYFQALLDFGVPGAICLLAAVFLFIKKELPTLAAWPVAAFILCYLCLGAIQYRMLEVPAWIAITAYVSANSTQKTKGDHAEV